VIRFGGIAYEPLQGETVLDCLLRNDLAIPHSCKAGVCQSCLLRATEGVVPTTGLKDTLVAQGYFLACACVPNGDVTVKQPERMSARIVALDRLSENVLRVRLHTDSRMPYFAGQFVNLFREDGLARSYSLASLPDEDTLEIHVRRVRAGVMSGWLFDEASPGTTIMLGGPSGDCFYVPGTPAERLLLAGSGTGLAPLYGIIRDALAHGHTGEIRLFHGGGTYLHGELKALAASHPNFLYLDNLAEVEKTVLAEVPAAKGWKGYLCGNPGLVKSLRKKLFLSGMASRSIHSDEFAQSATTLCS